MADRLHALAFNELTKALGAEKRWVPLSGRQRIADRLVALIQAETAADGVYVSWETLDLLVNVARYVSTGRSFVDVEPYPDATARRALGALSDEGAL